MHLATHPHRQAKRQRERDASWLRLLRRWTRHVSSREPVLYAVVAAAWTLWMACLFYSSMRLQTLFSYVWDHPAHFDQIIGSTSQLWSAPLDDVFIHFDFARSAARGYPLHWSEGNGYSSGGTSLLYPFTLAIGYLFFQGLDLMFWAALLACVCVFALLLSVRCLFRSLPRWTSYLAPGALLCVGALNWTLWSGMEVALFLAVWGGALIAWDDLLKPAEVQATLSRRPRSGLILGLWGALLVGVRPEAVTTVAVFSMTAALCFWRRGERQVAASILVVSAAPGMFVIAFQTLLNHVLTGESSAAGAIAKLELHHPYLTGKQVLDAYLFHIKYQVLRVTQYHLSTVPAFGWIVWVLAAVAFFSKKTRNYAILLWGSAVTWILIVALNGQVRWQNERYSMPALAWLLLCAALGVGVLLSAVIKPNRRAVTLSVFRITGTLAAISLFVYFQAPRFRDQVWFFGRASRNILDQHVALGRFIRTVTKGEPRRVLVGDAGAIPYVADVPALDIIGLGGYHDLPFARATRQGVAAGLELIERLPAIERPQLLALYPSWWGSLPQWFGETIREFPVRGNVIAGGLTKVLYRADWRPFEGSALPFVLRPHEAIIDEVDIADLVSERLHRYALSDGSTGYTVMKLLPHPAQPRSDVWDAGRVVPPGVAESLTLQGLSKGGTTRLILRTSNPRAAPVSIRINGAPLTEISVPATDGWHELDIDIPRERVQQTLSIEFLSKEHERTSYHLWVVQGP